MLSFVHYIPWTSVLRSALERYKCIGLNLCKVYNNYVCVNQPS